MKRKMPGKAVISLMLVAVLVLSATIGVFAGDYIAQDTTYEDGLTVDGSTGWNTADGDHYLVSTRGTTVTFTNTPFQRDTDNWSNFIVETISSYSADGISLRADAYGWTYGDGTNTPSYEVSTNWDWDDFATICTENTEITLTATKTSDTVVVFDILFGDSGYEEIYTVTYPNAVPDIWFHVGADGGTVTINSVDYVSITDITVESIPMTEYFTGDYFAVGGSVITVSYEDGSAETLTYGENSYVLDADGNYIYMYATNLEYGGSFYRGYDLYLTGSYGIYFEVCDYQGWEVLTTEATEENFVVRDIEASDLEAQDAQEMSLDTTYPVNIEVYGESDWFSFTPETSGYYAFVSSDCYGYTEDGEWYYSDPCAYVYYVDENGYITSYWSNYGVYDSNFNLRMYLDAGTTYYLRAYMYGSYSIGVYNVAVSETLVITEISVSSLSQTEFVRYAEEFDLTGTVVTVTYSDGSTADLTIDGSSVYDTYANRISYYVTYTYEYEDHTVTRYYYGGENEMPAGTYVVHIYDSFTGAYDESQTITVKEFADYDEITEIELLDKAYEVTDVESGTETWFSFTPADTSVYYFVIEADQEVEIPEDAYDYSYWNYPSVYYFNEDGERIYVSPQFDEENWEYLYDESGEYELYALTEGVTYFICVDYYGAYEIYAEDTGWSWYDGISADITISVQEVDHTHTYTAPVIDWTWSDDYTSATAVLRCDTCSHTETATATSDAITSVTTDATATADGSIVYTATVTIGGVEYTCTVTVVIPATGDTNSTSGDGTTTGDDGGTTTGDDNTTTADSSDSNTSSTGNTSTNTGDVSTMAYIVIILGAAVAVAVLAKKRVNE
ncbi:MAG: hypothetical protein LUE29_05380 [Lachnospiraceae bacterium]|nr:hypothetical protein [Lachnospiraceae bacterium]